jgi:hypothetical protein
MTPHILTGVTALADDGPKHSGINPPLNGVIVFVILMILLFITTRLNRDR